MPSCASTSLDVWAVVATKIAFRSSTAAAGTSSKGAIRPPASAIRANRVAAAETVSPWKSVMTSATGPIERLKGNPPPVSAARSGRRAIRA